MSESFGRYQLERRIAAGGMAEIFLASTVTIEGFKKQLIIKRMLPKWAKERGFINKFIDEAKLSSKLQHSNIVSVFDFGRHGDHYFIAAEYVVGLDMSDLIRQVRVKKGHVPDTLSAYIVEQVSAGLDFAHEYHDPSLGALRVVHRDVSPGNVMLSWAGQVKVADFGIAIAEQRMSETQPGTIHGKVAYMSPEQARGEPLDQRTDVYSTGLMLYELVTGVRALHASTTRDLLRAAQHPKISPPETHRDDLDGELSGIIAKALEPDRKARFKTSNELAEALQRYRVRLTALESSGTVARYLKQTFPSGVPEKKGAAAGGPPKKETKLLEERRREAQKEASENLAKSEVHTAWERQAAHYLRIVIDEPNVWKLIELADKARERGLEEIARGLYRASAAKFAQQGLMLQALTTYSALIDSKSERIHEEVTKLRGLRGRANASMRAYASVGDALVDPVLQKIFFDAKEPAAESVPAEPTVIASLTDIELGVLLRLIRPKQAVAGTTLLKHGERSPSVCIIGRGRVVLTVRNKRGETITVESLTHGDVFGEGGFFGSPQTTNVFAFDDVTYYEIRKADLDAAAQDLPNLQKKLALLYRNRVVDALLFENETFSLLNAKERKRLLEDAELLKLKPNAVIFDEGDTSDDVYLIKGGEAQRFSEGFFEGKLGPGDFFGEESALRRVARAFTIKAGAQGAEVAKINGGTLWKIVRKNPDAQRILDAVIDDHK
jgi:serine/threonine protein kinase/CRP-like cAMP-binding protein